MCFIGKNVRKVASRFPYPLGGLVGLFPIRLVYAAYRCMCLSFVRIAHRMRNAQNYYSKSWVLFGA